MISDVLFECIEHIKRYQTDPVFSGCYDDIREEIDQVVCVMDSLRAKLDDPAGVGCGINAPTDAEQAEARRLYGDD